MAKLFLVLLFLYPALARAGSTDLQKITGHNFKIKKLQNVAVTADHALSYTLPDNPNSLVKHYLVGQTTEVLTLSSLNTALNAAGIDSLGRLPDLEWLDTNQLRFITEGRAISFDTTSQSVKTLIRFKKEAQELHLAGTDKAAYQVGANIYLSIGEATSQITFDTAEGVTNGGAVHQQEFGIHEGIFWAPDASKFAFYRMDQRSVSKYPMVGIDPRPRDVSYIHYPMCGMDSHTVKVGIYDLATQKLTWVDENPSHYLAGITFSPDSRHLYISVIPRDQKSHKLKQFDAKTGKKIRTVFAETNDKYLEPQHAPLFINDEKLVILSRNKGALHPYIVDLKASEVTPLVDEEAIWEISDLGGLDANKENLFFHANISDPRDQHYYRLNLTTQTFTQLTTEQGVHQVRRSKDEAYLLDEVSTPEVEYKFNLLDKDGKKLYSYVAENRMHTEDLGTTTPVVLAGDDECPHDLYGCITVPRDFDPCKSYPTIVYVYGGPHVQLVRRTYHYGATLFDHDLARQGYIVFMLDSRGSANRGLAFEQEIHKNLGEVAIKDQLRGVKYLKDLPYVDASRFGSVWMEFWGVYGC